MEYLPIADLIKSVLKRCLKEFFQTGGDPYNTLGFPQFDHKN
jgi:hypothetical protein